MELTAEPVASIDHDVLHLSSCEENVTKMEKTKPSDVSARRAEEMFDLEVLVPVHPEGRWLERLEMFRRFGLLNIGRFRVRVVLLAGTFPLQAVEWEGVEEVLVLNGDSDHPSRKVYSSYHAMTLDDIGGARWFLRVDDDSVTDVGGLLAHLDRSCDWRTPHHLVGHLCQDVHPVYCAMLRGIGARHLLSPDGAALASHEWEVGLSSQSAMLRALSHPQARELLRLASEYEGGFADECLALCHRLAGLFPAAAPFLSSFEHVDGFSLWGGPLFHIHYLRPDNASAWTRFMNKLYQHGIERP